MRTFSQGSIMESANVVSAHIFWRQKKYAMGEDGASYVRIFFSLAFSETDMTGEEGWY